MTPALSLSSSEHFLHINTAWLLESTEASLAWSDRCPVLVASGSRSDTPSEERGLASASTSIQRIWQDALLWLLLPRHPGRQATLGN